MEYLQPYRDDFLLFCKLIYFEYSFEKHHQYICKEIQKEIKEHRPRFLFSMPPGHGKSTIFSKLLPAYLLGLNPKNRIMIVSWGYKLSNSFGKEVRRILNLPIYKLLFPNTIIAGKGESGTFETTESGCIEAVGRKGGINGFRFNWILADDIIKDKAEAVNDNVLESMTGWWPSTCYNRLYSDGGCAILATRWCKKDLIGWALSKHSDRWKAYNLEAICTNKEKDPLNREVGEALWPSWWPIDWLLEQKKSDRKNFNAQYQGNPVDIEVQPVKEDTINRVIKEYPKDKDYKIILSWDTASKTNSHNDYTCVTVWKIFNKSDIVNMSAIYRYKKEFPELLRLYDKLQILYEPILNIIEDANSGTQLLQVKKEKNNFCSKVIKDKYEQAEIFESLMNSNKLEISPGILKPEYIQEIIDFPYGIHDDIMLSIIHFVKWLLDDKTEIPIEISDNFKSEQMADYFKVLNFLSANLNNNNKKLYKNSRYRSG